jgi:hypothetical protein
MSLRTGSEILRRFDQVTSLRPVQVTFELDAWPRDVG